MHYVVDKSNRINEVDDSWDAGAAEQVGAGVGPTSDKIIGRPIEEFLVGDATKMFVRAAFDAARLRGESRRLPYRCDSQHEHRRFEMVISPLADNQVKVEHILVEARPRSTRPPRARLTAEAGWRCSQCLLVRLVGSQEWTDADLLPSELLAKDVCPTCAQRIFETGPLAISEPDGQHGRS